MEVKNILWDSRIRISNLREGETRMVDTLSSRVKDAELVEYTECSNSGRTAAGFVGAQ